MLNFSTSTFSTAGVTKAGRLGAEADVLDAQVQQRQQDATAFCSYQLRIIDSGRSLTPHLKASASATAIWMAE